MSLGSIPHNHGSHRLCTRSYPLPISFG
uniref:Uncharacterized protein n=1 Tax=Moniliophthora roreri TaxID=221103 RepID=A0A0W0FND7_MONRR